MYDVTPSVRGAWHQVLSWAARRANVELEIVNYPAPQPLERLWSRPDLGCTFMCGWPFAQASPQPQPIAAIVPTPPRYGGDPVYFTDFVVSVDSPYHTLPDTFGKTIAWTVAHSHSGLNAVRHHLLRYRNDAPSRLYGSALGPLIDPKRIIEAVIEGEVAVGPLDSYYHDLLRRHLPDLAIRLRTIETTVAAPFPPLVAGPAIDESSLRALREAFGAAHEAAELQDALKQLLVQRFVLPHPSDYTILLERAKAAKVAGFDFAG